MMKKTFFMTTICCLATIATLNAEDTRWVGTWSAAPQLVEPHNMPPAPGLSNNTLRQIVRISTGGTLVKLRFSNAFSDLPVTMKSVAIAVSATGAAINSATEKRLTFGGEEGVTMPAGGEAFSDPVAFSLESNSRLAISIYFGETSPSVTGHPGSRTTSYILAGNHLSSEDFAEAITTEHWYIIQGIDVAASQHSAVVAALGNSITDGRGSGADKQNRWTDVLSERLLNNPATADYGVLNLGIGGNCVLQGGLGPTALKRFDRDILSQNGVRWLIILEGINDIGGVRSEETAAQTAQALINAYMEMIDKAHEKGIKVFGCTLLPFAKSFYDTPFRQEACKTVNEWIRSSGKFDAVIDFNAIMASADEPGVMPPDVHTGDYLHPNESGYKKMGEAIDLNLFQ
ncbi:MAG: SGNH/GDSL hydrolase family protein [Tannerellaceae bacterium]|jgi:lysophospholipase L1-like esterase|nr:SGNH/GDSL hydrolase family protein [Tannerellaceae bacterium]